MSQAYRMSGQPHHQQVAGTHSCYAPPLGVIVIQTVQRFTEICPLVAHRAQGGAIMIVCTKDLRWLLSRKRVHVITHSSHGVPGVHYALGRGGREKDRVVTTSGSH